MMLGGGGETLSDKGPRSDTRRARGNSCDAGVAEHGSILPSVCRDCDRAFAAISSRKGEEKVMAKNKDDAKAEGFKRGLQGKTGSAGMAQGWTDDRAAGEARTEGYAEGKRKRSRLKAEETRAKGKK
jgi:hypothetical protein